MCIILAHERRRIVHVNVTEHSIAQWTVRQIAGAFPWDEALRYLLRDWSTAFADTLTSLGYGKVATSRASFLGTVEHAINRRRNHGHSADGIPLWGYLLRLQLQDLQRFRACLPASDAAPVSYKN